MKKKLTSEIIIGLTAMVISLSTLVVFVYQTNLIRKQQYMSVYPYLSITNVNSGSLNYKYVIENKGIGPALITKIEVMESSGKEYETLIEYVKQKISKNDSIRIQNSDIFEGRFIQAKEMVILFELSKNNSNKLNGNKNSIAAANRLREILNSDDLKIVLTYESIYGESWTITNKTRKPIKN